jgi:hypothetical protein
LGRAHSGARLFFPDRPTCRSMYRAPPACDPHPCSTPPIAVRLLLLGRRQAPPDTGHRRRNTPPLVVTKTRAHPHLFLPSPRGQRLGPFSRLNPLSLKTRQTATTWQVSLLHSLPHNRARHRFPQTSVIPLNQFWTSRATSRCRSWLSNCRSSPFSMSASSLSPPLQSTVGSLPPSNVAASVHFHCLIITPPSRTLHFDEVLPIASAPLQWSSTRRPRHFLSTDGPHMR